MKFLTHWTKLLRYVKMTSTFKRLAAFAALKADHRTAVARFARSALSAAKACVPHFGEKVNTSTRYSSG